MRLPIIPFVIAVTLLTAAVYFFFYANASDRRVLDVPQVNRLADFEGTETEIAIAPDGDRYVVIASGDVWLWKISTGDRRRIVETPEAEFFPAWTPDGRRVTFSRGADTFTLNPETNEEQLLKANATWLSWSPTGRIVFVRDRALWLADPNGRNEREIVKADANFDITIQTPRFSPDSIQVAFIKSVLHLRGEVWSVNVLDGSARPLVSDRAMENPSDVGWVVDGRHLVYMTNRAGAYSLWHIDFTESLILPLTQPLVQMPLQRIGIGVWKDRIVVPRHFIDSDIVISGGPPIAHTDDIEFQPAVSRDNKLVAFTVVKDNDFQVWTAGIDGSNAEFRTVGREPRFSPNGFEIVYTLTDLKGNEDIWRLDIRNSNSEHVTDAEEIDVTADWSPDGRTIVFSSARGGAMSIWMTPASGGKRLRLNDGGYAPRYSPDGKTISFWNQSAIWTMNADGANLRVREKNGKWPPLEALRDGRQIDVAVEILETGLWSVDLTYKEN